jgi:hypothetical protein
MIVEESHRRHWSSCLLLCLQRKKNILNFKKSVIHNVTIYFRSCVNHKSLRLLCKHVQNIYVFFFCQSHSFVWHNKVTHCTLFLSGAAIFKLALWWRCLSALYSTYRILFIALVTCLPTYIGQWRDILNYHLSFTVFIWLTHVFT